MATQTHDDPLPPDECEWHHDLLVELIEKYMMLNPYERHDFLEAIGYGKLIKSLHEKVERLAEYHAPYRKMPELRHAVWHLRICERLEFGQMAKRLNSQGFRRKDGNKWTGPDVKSFWQRYRQYYFLAWDRDLNELERMLDEEAERYFKNREESQRRAHTAAPEGGT